MTSAAMDRAISVLVYGTMIGATALAFYFTYNEPPYIMLFATTHHWAKYLAVPIAFGCSLILGPERRRSILLWFAGFLAGTLVAYSNFPS